MDPNPTIIVDTREQSPLQFTNFDAKPGTLYSGDYSIEGFEEHFSVERKSMDDLAASLGRDRGRFARECHRLRGFPFRRLVVVGRPQDLSEGRYRSKMTPKALAGSLAAFEIRYCLPVVWEATPEQAASRIETWAYYFMREMNKNQQPEPRETINQAV